MMKFLMCGMAVLVTACMSTQGEAKPVSISKEVQTVCMGRHQMELPADFVQSTGSVSIFTPPGLTETGGPIKVAIKSSKIDTSQYRLEVDKRHAAILKSARKATDVLKEVIALNKEATIFRIMEIDDAYKSELHLWKGGVYIVAITDSYENSFRQAEARLATFANEIEVTARNPQPGFCLGPVVVKGKYVGEYGKLNFQSKGAPDVVVSVVVDTYVPDESKTLLQRMSGSDSLLSKMNAHPKVLRKGELQVAGMRGQEWLGYMMLGKQAERKQYGFALETLRPAPAPLQPSIHLEFDTGREDAGSTAAPSALTDAEAMALWDAISKSIRVRAGN
jgi:hypothetical protein